MNGGGSRPILVSVPDGQGTFWSSLMLPLRHGCMRNRAYQCGQK
jgi:hypothetical protein